jgi:hypothetical protein
MCLTRLDNAGFEQGATLYLSAKVLDQIVDADAAGG